MRAHELKITELESQLSSLLEKSTRHEEEKSQFTNRLQLREDEIKRLSEVLESERNWDKIHVEHELKKHVKTISKLESQLDYLNAQRQSWEQDIRSFKEMGVSASYMEQLHEAQRQSHDAESRMAEMQQHVTELETALREKQIECDKLQHVQVQAHAVEQLQRTVKERDQQLEELQRKVRRMALWKAKQMGGEI